MDAMSRLLQMAQIQEMIQKRQKQQQGLPFEASDMAEGLKDRYPSGAWDPKAFVQQRGLPPEIASRIPQEGFAKEAPQGSGYIPSPVASAFQRMYGSPVESYMTGPSQAKRTEQEGRGWDVTLRSLADRRQAESEDRQIRREDRAEKRGEERETRAEKRAKAQLNQPEAITQLRNAFKEIGNRRQQLSAGALEHYSKETIDTMHEAAVDSEVRKVMKQYPELEGDPVIQQIVSNFKEMLKRGGSATPGSMGHALNFPAPQEQ